MNINWTIDFSVSFSLEYHCFMHWGPLSVFQIMLSFLFSSVLCLLIFILFFTYFLISDFERKTSRASWLLVTFISSLWDKLSSLLIIYLNFRGIQVWNHLANKIILDYSYLHTHLSVDSPLHTPECNSQKNLLHFSKPWWRLNPSTLLCIAGLAIM